jgi:two-component system, chemotaxis family, chemotaxis protein CheY
MMTQAEVQPAETRPSMTKTVLLVEDDEQIRAALQTGLQLSGYAVQVAADGREALEQLGSGWPDLVILDVMLPEMDGPAFAEELRRLGLRPAVPILLISADHDLGEKAAALGAEGYLRKPLKFPTLLAEVARLLRS